MVVSPVIEASLGSEARCRCPWPGACRCSRRPRRSWPGPGRVSEAPPLTRKLEPSALVKRREAQHAAADGETCPPVKLAIWAVARVAVLSNGRLTGSSW